MKISQFTDDCLFIGNLALSTAAYLLLFRHLSRTPWLSEDHVLLCHAVTSIIVTVVVIPPTVYLRKKVFHVDGG